MRIEEAGSRGLARTAVRVLFYFVMLILSANHQRVVSRKGDIALQRYTLGMLFVVGIGLIAYRQRFNHRAGDNLGRFDPVFKFALYCLGVCVKMDVLQVIPVGRVVVEKTDFLAFQLRNFDAKVVELTFGIVKPGLSG